MSDAPSVPGGLATTVTMARLTWTRMIRGRALWVGFLIALLPVMFAVVMRMFREPGGELFTIEVLVLAVLGPMFVGSSIGEEIEERTTTYLWSRPIPRWVIVGGKLAALAPLTALIVVVSWIASSLIAWNQWPPLQTCGALAAGAFVISFVSAGIATLAPRHGMALAIVYMLFFDFPVGILPATVQELSIGHQVRTLSGTSPLETGAGSAVIALAIISALWLVIAAVRVRRLEA